MTVNMLRGKKGDAAAPDAKTATPPIAIGEMDAHVFTCTTCGRPLADRTWTCPGCGTKFVLGVTAKRASILIAFGLAAGVLLGGLVTASAMIVSSAKPVAAAVPIATPGPVATATPTSAAVVPAGPPQAAVTALSGTALVNGRISTDAGILSVTLADRSATTSDIARGLRSLSADAAQGTDLVARLAQWPDAGPVGAQLGDFYRSLSDSATLALRDSLNDTSGYRSSATEMLHLLNRLAAVDTASRSLATTIDLELPPVVLPATH
jgi:hypothetical protein